MYTWNFSSSALLEFSLALDTVLALYKRLFYPSFSFVLGAFVGMGIESVLWCWSLRGVIILIPWLRLQKFEGDGSGCLVSIYLAS